MVSVILYLWPAGLSINLNVAILLDTILMPSMSNSA